MESILVVDDEPRITALLARALVAEGYAVECAPDGPSALDRMLGGRYDAVLLDLMLPGLDGIAVLRRAMARHPERCVVVVSAVPDVRAKIRCLDLGATDYVTKPFDVAEVVARIRSHLRRPAAGSAGRAIAVNGLRLDLRERTVDTGAGPVRLADREFRLMWMLAEHAGDTCSRALLLGGVWDGAYDTASKVLEVCVGRLRTKLGTRVIETVRNEGYRIGTA